MGLLNKNWNLQIKLDTIIGEIQLYNYLEKEMEKSLFNKMIKS